MTEKPYVLITGSTRGLGLSIAMELAGRGFVPVLNYRGDSSRAEHALAQVAGICSEAQLIRADVSTEQGVRRLFEVMSGIGPVDVLVNGVGRFIHKPFLDTSLDEWRDVMDSNLTSAILCCREVLPSMRQRMKGHIINIASMHADRVRSRPHTLPYAIAKAGIVHLTQTLAATEGRFGIRVNAVCPGFIAGGDATAPSYAQKVPLGRLGQAGDVAAAVAFLVSERASYITGAVLDIHGGALL